MHVHPQGGEKNWGPNQQGKIVSAPTGRACTPRQRKSPILRKCGEICTVGVVNLVVLARVLRATTKKVNFSEEEKCPPEKILATPMVLLHHCLHCSVSRSF